MHELIAMNPAELEKKTPKILGDHINTYVYTKGHCERILKKKKPDNFTLTIVRPSIIGCSSDFPTPGWIENITAASALFLLCGVGAIKYINVNQGKVGDLIPVDYVSDMCIVAGCLYANSKSTEVIHCGTSYRNPVTWGECANPVV